MERLKLKICGMKNLENIQEVSELLPDYMGFIFYDQTPRFFDQEIPGMPAHIKRTGVFVNASQGDILEKTRKYHLKAIQLHGHETPEFCRELRKKLANYEVEILKVFSVGEALDFTALQPYEGLVDFFLFDTRGKTRGGTGKTFNWELLKAYPSSTPFFLSGGIGPEAISAIEEVRTYFQRIGKGSLLYALDINSRFEEEPGLKDIKKLKEFQKALRNKEL